MQIRTGDLYIRPGEEPRPGGRAAVRVHMRADLKCKGGKGRSVELGSGTVVCASCEHGPCALPYGVGHDCELRIIKDKRR